MRSAAPILCWLLAGALPALAQGEPEGGGAEAAAGADGVVAYTVRDAAEIPESLTGSPGDAAAGEALFAGEAGCTACHEAQPPGAGLGQGEIRLWIVAPMIIAPETEMPAFYLAGQRRGPEDPRFGGPQLNAREIEDIVAYLAGQKGEEPRPATDE